MFIIKDVRFSTGDMRFETEDFLAYLRINLTLAQ